MSKMIKKKEKTKEVRSRSLSEKLNDFFDRNEKRIAILSMIFGALMCILLFDVKVSLSGDDSDYIIFAENFWKQFIYPGYHGALYPIILSPFVGIFGYNLILLKMLSCVFMVAFLWLFYKTFRGQISNAVLLPVLLLISINSYIFFYASQTYSEALFMLMQGVFFLYFFKYFLSNKSLLFPLKSTWKKYIILAILVLMMGLTRSIGYGAIGVIILFFTINRQWKKLLYSLCAFGLVFIVFQFIKTIVWPEAGSSYNIDSLLAKDFYNPVERESIGGLFNRFIENSLVYLSAFLYQFMGLVNETPSNYMDINNGRTIIMYLLFAICLIMVLKIKHNALLFTGLYVGVLTFISFIVLHSFWGQDRIIMVFYPFILLFLLGGIYYLFQVKVLRSFFFVYPAILLVIFIGTFSITKNRVARNVIVLQQNMLGDQLYGLTPDWQNFIKASKWAAKNLDPEAKIISRKSTISKVYTGRDFEGDPHALSAPLDSFLQLKVADNYTAVVIGENSELTLRSPYFKYLIGSTNNTPFEINKKQSMGVYLHLIPNTEIEAYTAYLNQAKMSYTFDYKDVIRQTVAMSGKVRIYDPDILLKYLLDNKIDYLLLAQLRTDPTKYTGSYLNSIHRFVWYISFKYPDLFHVIHKEGKVEPCEVVQFVH